MNALEVGGLLVLYLVSSQAIGGFIENQTTPTFLVGDCEDVELQGDNQTQCQSVTGPTFVQSAQQVAVSGFSDAPDWVNGIWVGIHAFLLTLAVILIVCYFLGLFFGGSG